VKPRDRVSGLILETNGQNLKRSRDSSVGIVAVLQARKPGFGSRQRQYSSVDKVEADSGTHSASWMFPGE
jgi:hypothetical protein